ncbi:MAG: CcoQ/FixQ family Cbb3-type cytochrome c oxidase assembly chaperone [Betaproteobacteria bacterium HGW-Betaproteobacteria-16]|nr:MAG: CcoQ/FixQ family Cbb3-type cytochrome c oxidase assembly chaperone [Betaproteobacteria bacterium HGW-Betaproteobacteria-16]
MEINELRSIVTVVSLITFVGIVIWAWSKRNKSDFDEAARLPFNED